MTNEQIIADAATKIWGKEVVENMLLQGIEIPLHSYQFWKLNKNMVPRRGEHGIEVKLWRKRNNKNISEDGEQIPNEREYYLTKCYLFRADQVSKIDN